MKRILFVGLIALLVLLAVPAVMAADISPSGVLVQPAIDVSIVGGASPSFGNLITGAACNEVKPSDGMPSVKAEVTGNGVTGWAVTAKTADLSGSGIPKGKMYTADLSQYLTDFFQIGHDTSPYYTLDTDVSSFMSGSTAETVTKGLWMKQCIETSDADGTYTITVSFTGTVTGTS